MDNAFPECFDSALALADILPIILVEQGDIVIELVFWLIFESRRIEAHHFILDLANNCNGLRLVTALVSSNTQKRLVVVFCGMCFLDFAVGHLVDNRRRVLRDHASGIVFRL